VLVVKTGRSLDGVDVEPVVFDVLMFVLDVASTPVGVLPAMPSVGEGVTGLLGTSCVLESGMLLPSLGMAVGLLGSRIEVTSPTMLVTAGGAEGRSNPIETDADIAGKFERALWSIDSPVS
jgi:hypothetical protein